MSQEKTCGGEDSHIDQATGFEPKGSTFFFGKAGAEYAERPFMKLAPERGESCLQIAVSDFLLFNWAISWHIRELFDEYENYEFSADQWGDILNTAENILRFDSFDDLFDYLTGPDAQHRMGGNDFLPWLNCRGAEFWKNKEKYRTQLKDMRAWTELVLPGNGSLKIYGF